MTLILIAIAFMAGIVAGDLQPAGAAAIAACAGCSLALCIALRRQRCLALIVGLTAMALLGAWRGAIAEPKTTAASVQRWAGQEIVLHGVVAEEPRWSEKEQRAVIEARAAEHSGKRRAAEGLVLVTLPPEPALLPGTPVVLKGLLKQPRSGRSFDYAAYLARRHIFITLDEAVLLRAGQPPPGLRTSLLQLKRRAAATVLALLPEPEAGLLSGILLGLQGALSDAVAEDFSITGTSHILVISGWNISVTIAGALWLAGRVRLRQWPATLLALGAVGVYVVFVGPSATVVRSAIMGTVVALAAPLGRRSDAWTALAFACLAMCLLDPNVLWDMGFQLSAGAVAGLFACGEGATRLAERLLRPRWLHWAAEPLAATFAAQVFTLPLLLYQFGTFSLIAPLANVVMLPAVPLAMGLGAATVAGGLIWRPLGLLLALPCWLPLAWLTRSAAVLSSLPYAAVLLRPFPLWMLLAYYPLVIGLLILDTELDTGAPQPAPP